MAATRGNHQQRNTAQQPTSTHAAIAAAAMSGTDLGARANAPVPGQRHHSRQSIGGAGAGAGAGTATEFNGQEASNWLNARWRAIESAVNDPSLAATGECRASSVRRIPGKVCRAIAEPGRTHLLYQR